jgi:SAM-dependent methyltransferase
MTDPDLNAAYALNGPDDCRRLYAAWAESYDSDFAAGMDYILPAQVAAAFVAAAPMAGTVLDVGAGTGLLGAALRGAGFAGPLDGIDLVPDMLARAARLGLYRTLLVGDVTRPLPPCGPYQGIVSSGTFTHGHVGPEALSPLLDVAAPGALFALSVNAGVWDSLGFAGALDALPITGLDTTLAPIYGPGAAARDPAHAADRALIVTFRKA